MHSGSLYIPEIWKKFEEQCHGVIRKSINIFSMISINQSHEQNNEVKDFGGAVELTENAFTFRKWMISGLNKVGYWKSLKKNNFRKTNIQSGAIIMKNDYLDRKVS